MDAIYYSIFVAILTMSLILLASCRIHEIFRFL